MLRCLKKKRIEMGHYCLGMSWFCLEDKWKDVGKVILMMINGEGMARDSGLMIGNGKER
jgi:hypothetical protein